MVVYLKTFLKTIFFLGHPVVICIYKMHKSAKVQLFSPPLPLLVCLKHPSGKRTWMKRSPTGTYRHQKRRFEEETGLVWVNWSSQAHQHPWFSVGNIREVLGVVDWVATVLHQHHWPGGENPLWMWDGCHRPSHFTSGTGAGTSLVGPPVVAMEHLALRTVAWQCLQQNTHPSMGS